MGTRKTITFDKEVFDAIQKYRAYCMIEKGEDKNFTDAVNELLKEIIKRKCVLGL